MNKQKILAVLMLVWILSSCTNGAIQQTEEPQTQTINLESFQQNISKAKQQIQSYQQTSNSDIIQTNDADKTLSVNYKCIACDKCTRIAPDNFAMDWGNRIAVVTSQEGLYGDRVAMAIQRCPVDAIEIG